MVEGDVGHVCETAVEHVLGELVVVLEEDALVVESDGLVEVAGEVVDEGEGEVGVGVLAVVLQTLGLVEDGVVVVLEFAVGLAQVVQDLEGNEKGLTLSWMYSTVEWPANSKALWKFFLASS